MRRPGKQAIGWTGGAILAALAAVNVVGTRWLLLEWIWLLDAALLAAFVAAVGWGINGRPVGLFIDNRNRVSLSKFQAGTWTVLVLSALLAAAGARVAAGHAGALEIEIPAELLVAMGISMTSLVATPTLLSLKTEAPSPPPEVVDEAARKLGQDATVAQTSGKVFGRTDPHFAEWFDMFRGDEVSNTSAADLSKVQQFLITLALIGVYAASLWRMFSDGRIGGDVMPLPALHERFVWLLGLSHAGYLSYKVAPHDKRTDTRGAEALEEGAVG